MFHQYISKILKLPFSLVFFILLNAVFGIVVLYSAGDNNFYPWAYKQTLNLCIFFPIMILISVIDIRFFYENSYGFYIFVVILLILVALFGHTAMGAKRWLNIVGFKIQPSELSKISLVLFLSRYFHNLRYEDIGKIKPLLVPIIGLILPVIMIIRQPDLGTGMVALFVGVTILFTSGVKIWKFGLVGSVILVLTPLIWSMLHDYQKNRILVFLNPEHDPLGSGYNIIQSKIAIGSGGIWGKGLGEGTQSHLSFLPEHQTDFIFACLSEEFGLVGSGLLILLYSIIIYLCISISIYAKNVFSKLLVIGITSIFFIHICINIGMVTGLLPVVGIPLPLISYGGTMMASILIGFGLIMNVHVHHFRKL